MLEPNVPSIVLSVCPVSNPLSVLALAVYVSLCPAITETRRITAVATFLGATYHAEKALYQGRRFVRTAQKIKFGGIESL